MYNDLLSLGDANPSDTQIEGLKRGIKSVIQKKYADFQEVLLEPQLSSFAAICYQEELIPVAVKNKPTYDTVMNSLTCELPFLTIDEVEVHCKKIVDAFEKAGESTCSKYLRDKWRAEADKYGYTFFVG